MMALLALIGIGFAASVFIDSPTASSNSDSDFDTESFEDEASTEVSSQDELTERILTHTEPDDGTVIIDAIEFDEEFISDRNVVLGDPTSETIDGSAGAFGESGDHIFGGGGDDILVGGLSDVLIGGDGEDHFIIDAPEPVYILDLEQSETISIHYSGHVPSISADATDSGTTIFADGLPTVHLEGVYDFDLTRVSLISET